jgi:hypothetical protein
LPQPFAPLLKSAVIGLHCHKSIDVEKSREPLFSTFGPVSLGLVPSEDLRLANLVIFGIEFAESFPSGPKRQRLRGRGSAGE